MIISKALGTYNMKDANICLTQVALIIENTSALPKYQFCIVTPFKDIEKVAKHNNALLITKRNSETMKIVFYKKSKLETFYNYLLKKDTTAQHNADECIYCGTILQGEYCTACGHKRVEIMQPQETTAQTYRCWSCGAEFEDKVAFCSECGAKQDVNKLLVRIGAEMVKKDLYNICPRCGSHNIKHYRKGYNYKVGFWGAIFGVKGAGYAGGFDANKTCCRCMDCGKDWETDYDYRLINK